jgi:hypothetical protein
MAKVTIYVPDELKAAMDKVEVHNPNWSGLAQEAFRRECERLAGLKKERGKMEAAVERLRQSKQIRGLGNARWRSSRANMGA